MTRLRTLFVVNHPILGASSRYRVYQFLDRLKEHGIDSDVRPFTNTELYELMHTPGTTRRKLALTTAAFARRLKDLLSARRYDTIFIHREALPFGPPLVELLFQKLSRRLVFDFDDAIYLPFPYAHEQSQSRLYRWKYERQIGRICAVADRVVAGNEVLAKYAREFSTRVRVIPTVVDTDAVPFVAPRERETLTIGWMGSGSTSRYLEDLKPVFERLGKAYAGHIRLKVVGGDQPLEMGLPVTHKPWRLDDELADLRSFDIGLMPLADDDWSRGKCALKAINYLAAGTPTVASAIGPVIQMMRSAGLDHCLATNATSWETALQRLIEDLGLRRTTAAAGRRIVEHQYSVQAALPALIEVLTPSS